MYCLGETLLWLGFLILGIMIGFLLTLHCLLYKKVNKRCSWRILGRNRV